MSDRLAALRDYGECAGQWARMATHHGLLRPHDLVGSTVEFADGSTSRIFRETCVADPVTAEPVLLVIRFRLAFLGDVEALHTGFRYECLIHTPLFAGFPGFRSKLWLEDLHTRTYRGIYQWDGADAATAYAGRMVGLLAPFSNRGTARWHIVPGLLRSVYLGNPDATTGGADDAWWRLARGPG
jgi:hypothetical protein